MTILCFGTYDRARHPRISVLIEGLTALGHQVNECNVPLRDSTQARVAALRRPTVAVTLAFSLLRAWWQLWRRARQQPAPRVVLVGYLGHLDVHLARFLWPRAIIVLDHLVSLEDTALDRRAGGMLPPILRRIDRAALAAADIIIVDTGEQGEATAVLPRVAKVVVPVGAPTGWFAAPAPRDMGPLRVVFFGLYTPLQGAPVIGSAIGLLRDAPIAFRMIGTGQDYEETRALAEANSQVAWCDWAAAEDLPRDVAAHDVCLGIFGTGPKGLRVVPNKVFQGAAAGCAIVTSDTVPQRAAMQDAAIYVPPGSAEALADALRALCADRPGLWRRRQACYERARLAFAPAVVVEPLSAVLERQLNRSPR